MTSWTPTPARRWRRVRRYAPWIRRALALVCLALAALTAGQARPAASPAPEVPTLVATHPLSAGATLSADDLRLQPWPSAVRPSTALDSAAGAIGRRVSSAVGAGEAVTTSRLIDPDAWALLPGLSAATITLADENGGALLHTGDVIDLIAGSGADDALAVGDSAPRDAVVADGVTVLQVLPSDSSPPSTGHSTQIVVGVDRETAIRLAATLGVPMLATVHRRP